MQYKEFSTDTLVELREDYLSHAESVPINSLFFKELMSKVRSVTEELKQREVVDRI